MICPICEGRKVVYIETMLPDGLVYDYKRECWKCDGAGEVEDQQRARPVRQKKRKRYIKRYWGRT